VVCDLDVLDTLPDREMSAGLAEVVKYGASIDVEFLAWLERHIDELRARDRAALVDAVQRCCEIKAQVVGVDEKEAGLREILNFGHTFGHAIEAGMGYGAWLHGEGVGCGMVMAAELSARLGLVSEGFARRVESLVARAGLPVRGPRSLSPARYIELMRVDKKAQGGDIRFVLLDGEGHATVRTAPETVVVDVLRALTAAD
jgi:3-dehydroquinate synthase